MAPGAVEAGQICMSMCPGAKMESYSALNPVDVGACHGLTLKEIRDRLGSECLEVSHPAPALAPSCLPCPCAAKTAILPLRCSHLLLHMQPSSRWNADGAGLVGRRISTGELGVKSMHAGI